MGSWQGHVLPGAFFTCTGLLCLICAATRSVRASGMSQDLAPSWVLWLISLCTACGIIAEYITIPDGGLDHALWSTRGHDCMIALKDGFHSKDSDAVLNCQMSHVFGVWNKWNHLEHIAMYSGFLVASVLGLILRYLNHKANSPFETVHVDAVTFATAMWCEGSVWGMHSTAHATNPLGDQLSPAWMALNTYTHTMLQHICMCTSIAFLVMGFLPTNCTCRTCLCALLIAQGIWLLFIARIQFGNQTRWVPSKEGIDDTFLTQYGRVCEQHEQTCNWTPAVVDKHPELVTGVAGAFFTFITVGSLCTCFVLFLVVRWIAEAFFMPKFGAISYAHINESDAHVQEARDLSKTLDVDSDSLL